MDILGIGPLELFFIILIALIVLGPKDMVKAGRTIGKNLRKIVTSENWRTIQQASNEIRTLPNRLMRDAGLDEIQKDIKTSTDGLKSSLSKDIDPIKSEAASFNFDDWTKSPNTIAPQAKTQPDAPVEPPPGESTGSSEQS
jgi:Sec-independent protein translocase protein TatA